MYRKAVVRFGLIALLSLLMPALVRPVGAQIVVTAPVAQPPVSDARIDAPGMLYGRVEGTLSADMQVQALQGRHVVASAPVDARGKYILRNLPAGQYTLQAVDRAGHVQALLDGASAQVEAGGNTNVALKLVPQSAHPTLAEAATPAAVPDAASCTTSVAGTGKISGKVVAAGTLTPIQSAYVVAVTSVGTLEHTAFTNASGDYEISGLDPGQYRVMFSPKYSGGNYLTEFYNNKHTYETATTVAVTNAHTTPNINAALDPGATVKGTITTADTHHGLSHVYVILSGSTGSYSTYTSATGTYGLWGIPSGTYTLSIRASYGTDPYLDREVVVAGIVAPQTKTVNVALVHGATITGKVYASGTTTGFEDALVTIYTADGNVVDFAYTDQIGMYRSVALPSGSYKMEFDPTSFARPTDPSYLYVGTFSGGQPSLALATEVTVTAPATKSVNQGLATGAQIKGKVTAPGATPGTNNFGIQIIVYNGVDQSVTTAGVDASGNYTTHALHAGVYKLAFKPQYFMGFPFGNKTINPYIGEFYPDKATLETATPVTLGTTGSVVANATLAKGAQITGKVTIAGTTTPVAAAVVGVFDNSGAQLVSAETNPSGEYTTDAIPSGSDRVQFFPPRAAGLKTEFYNNRLTFVASNPVAVVAPNLKTGINAALEHGTTQSGGCISGRVTAASGGAGLPGILATLYDVDGNYITSETTNELGFYFITGVPTGSYKVRFESNVFNPSVYAPEYYDNPSTPTHPDVISLVAPAAKTGINGALDVGAQISGTVTAVGGGGLGGVGVLAYDEAGDFVAYVTTGPTGDYTLIGLATGKYRLRFSPRGGSGYLSEYFNDRPTLSSATPITVVAPNVVSRRNAALTRGGMIQGYVGNQTTHKGLPLVKVIVYDATRKYVTDVTTDNSGFYQTKALAAGSYTLQFVPASSTSALYASEFYDDKATLGAALMFSVAAGSTRVIAGNLSPGAHISGKATASGTGEPLVGVNVTVYDSTGLTVGSGVTGLDGTYLTTGLKAGTYRVGFRSSLTSAYKDLFWKLKTTLATATPITVPASGTVGSINAVLTR